jgi:nitrate/TMAO reductase-like tetraheme cytochrome c subunit
MAETAANTPSVAPHKRSRWKRWLIVTGIVCAVSLILGSAFVGVAEYKTSQPQFCSSCHIMEPYYETWAEDVHGSKLEVACVECHYAPGERTTLKAKFRGLSQVASYFSGRYGAGKPRAYVSDLSCMTAQCHGDRKFMGKPLMLGTVKFTHANHLDRDSAREKQNEERFAALQKSLEDLVGQEHYKTLYEAVSVAGPADERYDKLAALCEEWKVQVERSTLVEFSQLRHREVRLAQLDNLQCTSCHSYHATDQSAIGREKVGNHFQVSTSTCYTCHFNNEGFNTGTSSCLSCHTPPQQEITVHAQMAPPLGKDEAPATDAATNLVKMNHTDILARKVSCASCHADAIQHDAIVTRRECEQCHDQARFFTDWKETFTVDLVERYHAVHVEQQRAKCLDCHTEIQHRLVSDTGSLFASALADCARCHPNHHAAQVDLLLGKGGLAVPKSAPNLMFGARTNCTGCHTTTHGNEHGEVLKATAESCVACHGDKHKDTFEKWKLGVELSLSDAEAAYANAREALDKAKAAPEAARKKAVDLLAGAEADLKLVKAGNGLHNVAYAMELLDSVSSRCREAVEALGTE